METYENSFTVIRENVLKICRRNPTVLYEDDYIRIHIKIGAKFIILTNLELKRFSKGTPSIIDPAGVMCV